MILCAPCWRGNHRYCFQEIQLQSEGELAAVATCECELGECASMEVLP